MPKTREQNQLIKEERKAIILDAALYEFAMNGYAAVKIDDITKRAKCSHGLFYHYYATKEAVFHDLMDVSINKINDIKNAVNYNQKAKFALHDLIEAILFALKDKDDSLASTYYLLSNMHLQKDIIPRPNKNISKENRKHKKLHEQIYDLILEGQEEGDFVNVDASETTLVILCMFKGLSFNRIQLGAKKFICPNAQVIMNIVNKRNVVE